MKPHGTIAFMSSGLGSIENNTYGSWETYRLSKAALNMRARSFFHRHSAHAVLCDRARLGRTDMGGASATFDVERVAATSQRGRETRQSRAIAT